MKKRRIGLQGPLWLVQERNYLLGVFPYWKTLLCTPFLVEAEAFVYNLENDLVE